MLDPSRRLTATEALQDQYFVDCPEDAVLELPTFQGLRLKCMLYLDRYTCKVPEVLMGT